MPARKATKASRKSATSRKISKKRTTKKRPPSKSKSPKTRKPAKHKLPHLPLLILECDADRLAREGMAMGSQIQALTNLLPSDNCDVELALINSQDDLRRAFTEYSSRYRSIRIIVIIGHSDAWGIRISTSQQMSLAWGAVAKWFQPFEPLYLVLAACKAGQCPSKAAFFDELESLEAMFASPVNISRLQAEILKVLVPYLLLVEEIDPEEIFVGQVLTFLGSGAILLYCQRQDSDWNNLLQVGTLLRDLFS